MEKIDLQKAEELVTFIDAKPRDTWIKVGTGLKHEYGDEAFDAWDRWSRTADNYDPKVMQGQWKSFKKDCVRMGTIVYLAKKGGWQQKERKSAKGPLENNAEKLQVEGVAQKKNTLTRENNSNRKFKKWTLQKVEEELLTYIDPQPLGHWITVGVGLKDEFGDKAFSAWDRWSKAADNYDSTVMEAQWDALKTSPDSDYVHFGSVIHLAKEGGWHSGKTGSPKGRINRKTNPIWQTNLLSREGIGLLAAILTLLSTAIAFFK